jgi:hypothetical protein
MSMQPEQTEKREHEYIRHVAGAVVENCDVSQSTMGEALSMDVQRSPGGQVKRGKYARPRNCISVPRYQDSTAKFAIETACGNKLPGKTAGLRCEPVTTS